MGDGGSDIRNCRARLRSRIGWLGRRFLGQGHVSHLHRGLQLGSRLRSRSRGFSFARLRGRLRGRRSEGEQQVVAGAALLHSVGGDRDQTGVAGAAQAGENLSVG